MVKKQASQAASPQHEDVVGSGRIALHDISLSEDSGWRDLDPEHVVMFVRSIKDGQWGRTQMARPSLRCQLGGEPMLSAIDGKKKLRNGKHIIAALLEVQEEHMKWHKEQNPNGGESPNGGQSPWDYDLPWLVPALKQGYEEGFLLDFYLHSDPSDNAAHIALQVYDHESAQNTYVESSLWDRCQAYIRIRERENDHNAAEEQLAIILGGAVTKRRTAKRWRTLACDLDEETRLFLKEPTAKCLTQAMLVDNNYFLGRGPQQRYRLTPQYARRVIRVARSPRRSSCPNFAARCDLCSSGLRKP